MEHTMNTEKALSTTVAYQAMLKHTWLRNDLSGAIDLEQAGHALRADFELCYSEIIQNKPIAALLAIALDSIEWQSIAKSLMHKWGLPLPVQMSR